MGLYEFVANNVPVLVRPSLLLGGAVYRKSPMLPGPQYSATWSLTSMFPDFAMTILEVTFTSPLDLFNLTKLRFKSFARLWRKNGTETRDLFREF